MRQHVQYDGDLVSRVGMGTRPSVLLQALRCYRPQTQMESRVDINAGDGGLDHVLNLLAAGKPVIALINPSGQSVDIHGPFGITLGHLPQSLHYVVLTGYDRLHATVSFMNTNGHSVTESFGQFNQQWNWSAGGAAGDFLTGTLGIAERTILY